MPSLKVNRRKKRLTPVGDMNRKIEIYSRNIQAPIGFSAINEQELTYKAKPWAKVETLDTQSRGVNIFDNVNQDEQPDTLFTIRRIGWLTTEYRVKFECNWYEILAVDSFEHRNDFQLLSCRLVGSADLEANK